MKYRVIEHNMYDELCEVERTYYTVEELVPAMFSGEKYKALKHRECSGYDVYMMVTEFSSTEHANALIDKLNKGIPRDTLVSRVVK